eukprot:NODE_10619_length_435_cov_2.199482_g9508_i0.p2 GENE.NODE_10619_length_435_cov_2.199482_g9508_i0~~NODE_10619_length_435_cov_2.199482_g9508_i0.p2  ORF type:complete len:112 (+),score=24.74 NODE_10619_length_435_cov_2.199482_g9508_i0:80-415(+)
MAPQNQDYPAYGAGALVGLNGILSFVQTRSIPLLAGGLLFGGGFLLAANMISTGRPKDGHMTAAGLGGLLAALSTPSGFAPMPNTIYAVVGGLSLLYHGKKTYDWSQRTIV